MPLLSIIIPVYNLELYLDRCVQSILRQPFSDYEVILVNNASTDNSGRLCDMYARANKQVKAIHLDVNRLPAGARNAGLNAAGGSYIHFCDGDDYYQGGTFPLIAMRLAEYSPEVLLGQFICSPEKGAYVCNDYQLDSLIINNSDATGIAAYLLTLPSLLCTPWRLVARRELLLANNLYFTEGYHCEDEEWFVKAICCASSFSLLPTPFYHYCPRAQGSITANKGFVNSKSQLVAALNLLNFLNKQGYSDAKEQLILSRVRFLLGLFSSRCDTFNVDQLEEVAAILQEKEETVNLLSKYSEPGGLYCFLRRFDIGAGLFEYRNYIIKKTISAVGNNLDRDKEIFIFPTGYSGEGCARIFKEAGVNVKGFLDNSEYKIGNTVEGLPVFSPGILMGHPNHTELFVLIATQQESTAAAIKQQLSNFGLKSSQYVWHHF